MKEFEFSKFCNQGIFLFIMKEFSYFVAKDDVDHCNVFKGNKSS